MEILGWIVGGWLLIGFVDSFAWQWGEEDWSPWGFIYITAIGPIGVYIGYRLVLERITGRIF